MTKLKLSRISLFHYIKLIFRSLLFIGATASYVIHRINGRNFFEKMEKRPFILAFLWVAFVIEMILRFFPSGMESMGCQKQFAKNYIPTGEKIPKLQSKKVTLLIAVGWLAFNVAIGVFYSAGLIDSGILLLVSLAFSVCDMICILFFCPFQTWFMKNKCCGSCRIYNWDYAMMFTPLIFVRSHYTWSLFGIALLLLIFWEVAAYIHPERFSETTNASLSCANCEEKLCHHKRQLQAFVKELKIAEAEALKRVKRQ